MARTQKYPGIGLAAVKKFCHQCVNLNGDQNRRYRLEYAGLAEENGNFYLVDGFRMVRFRYDIPELEHAEKKNIGGQPFMLHFIDDAHTKVKQMGKAGEVELPDIEEVRAAVELNKWAKKRKQEELPIPLAGGRIWVNSSYLLDMMQIFPMQRIVSLTGNDTQPILFGCEGADGILMPVRPKNMAQTMEKWAERKAQFEAEAADGPKKPKQRKPKRDNLGQPTSLAQLKKRLTVGAAFEIKTISGELQQRRIIKKQTNAIVSIVPFDAEHKVTAGGGNWIWFESAAKWAFADGWCKYLGDAKDPDFAIFSIRLLDTTAEEDERYNTWLADMEAQRIAERLAAEQAEEEKQAQEINEALTAVETAIYERGKRVNNDDICGKCVVLRLAEKYGINVPLRTAGWIAKNLIHFAVVGDGMYNASIQIWARKKTPQGVRDILFDILHAVDSHFEELAEPQGGEYVPTEATGADSIRTDGQEHTDSTSPKERAEMSVSDVVRAIYKEYTTENMAGGQKNDTS